jgi:hypothetical protein
MLSWFEKLVDPYPTKDLNKPLPTTFLLLFGNQRKESDHSSFYLLLVQLLQRALRHYSFLILVN